jgi:OmpA-OmpF porin, OOP family
MKRRWIFHPFYKPTPGRYIRFFLRGTDNNMQHVAAISNITITEEGEDLRSMLLKGGFSTTKILFSSGSDEIRPESYEFLQKVGKAINDESGLRIMIVGHTDSDGDEVANMNLSKARAASVANYLIDYTGMKKTGCKPRAVAKTNRLLTIQILKVRHKTEE